jgi:anti-sigma regulatory factor (Ser/Thr protein kinase)
MCDFIADIVQNALEAGSRFTKIDVLQDARSLAVKVTDTGKGMTEEELLRARDPFTTDGKKHPGRRVGLGIPFLAQTAALTEGDFDIRSRPGEGTSVFFRFNLEHPDTPPMGSLPETFRQILSLPGDYEMEIQRQLNTESYKVLRSEIIETLEDISSAGSLNLLKTYLESLEDSLVSP